MHFNSFHSNTIIIYLEIIKIIPFIILKDVYNNENNKSYLYN
jgi:hypothetical protein